MSCRGVLIACAWSSIACTSIAGLDGDYTLGSGTAGASATSSSAQASSTSRASVSSTSSTTGGGGMPAMDWVVIDTITVQCTGGDSVSTVSLNVGETYLLRASGACTCTGSTGCDAEWLDFGVPQTLAFSGDVDMGSASTISPSI